MKDSGKGALSMWLNTALNRPDTIFRDEIVIFTGISLAKASMPRGGNVSGSVIVTGDRDIVEMKSELSQR